MLHGYESKHKENFGRRGAEPCRDANWILFNIRSIQLLHALVTKLSSPIPDL
jgi:hypothetical protein